ncbi:GntR family transcriptional regulator [Roseomonas sp. NAR14]|uniref:GntR family transcriptional regulator n=1 Tax=Roseomonas acroporae TaxID=2937791 RepID=A0A9X1YA87_9PROT|nr:GntR family transcriptional regulator [Roseomonas acroporae]
METETGPIQGENLGARVYNRLRRDLMRSRFRPGEKLKLRDLALELGVSPTPVREALARLVSEHGLEQFDHRSVRVPVLTEERCREILSLRAELEGRAAERAAERPRPEAAEALRAIHDRMIAAGLARRPHDMLAENERFHMLMAGLSGQVVLGRIIEGLWLQCGPLQGGLALTRMRHPRDRHPHLEIIRGVREGDAALARLAMQQDINVYTEELIRRLPALNAAPPAAPSAGAAAGGVPGDGPAGGSGVAPRAALPAGMPGLA